jgi:hypothetical protein
MIPATPIDLDELSSSSLLSPRLTIEEQLGNVSAIYVISLMINEGDEDAIVITKQGAKKAIAINVSDLSSAWRAVYDN